MLCLSSATASLRVVSTGYHIAHIAPSSAALDHCLVRDSASVANFHILVVVVCLLEFENLVPDSIYMLSLRFLVLTRLCQASVESIRLSS